MRRTFTDAQAIKLIKNTSLWSVTKVVQRLTGRTGGTSFKMVYKIVDRYGLDTSHWLGCGWRKNISSPIKSNDCYFTKRNGRISGQALLAALIKRGFRKRKCEECERTRWNKSLVPLEVHHIDGDPTNNVLSNLKVLCRNCHAQTPNFGSKNRKVIRAQPRRQKSARSPFPIGRGGTLAYPAPRRTTTGR